MILKHRGSKDSKPEDHQFTILKNENLSVAVAFAKTSTEAAYEVKLENRPSVPLIVIHVNASLGCVQKEIFLS
jgi:hypothetical protein